jgi:GcrA cell cycle regulator
MGREARMGDEAAWSDERIDLLKTMWAEGKTAADIAAALGGVSRSAVLGKVFRLRLDVAEPPTGPTPRNSASSSRQRKGRPRSDARRGPGFGGPSQPTSSLARRRGGARQERLRESLPPPVPARGKSLLELTNHTCRWPHGRPGTPTFHFCGAAGADLERGMPYCEHHARRAYCGSAGKSEGVDRRLTGNKIPQWGRMPSVAPTPPPRRFILKPRWLV